MVTPSRFSERERMDSGGSVSGPSLQVMGAVDGFKGNHGNGMWRIVSWSQLGKSRCSGLEEVGRCGRGLVLGFGSVGCRSWPALGLGLGVWERGVSLLARFRSWSWGLGAWGVAPGPL